MQYLQLDEFDGRKKW